MAFPDREVGALIYFGFGINRLYCGHKVPLPKPSERRSWALAFIDMGLRDTQHIAHRS